jgi:DNA-binding beta-propeller fold protein YncE
MAILALTACAKASAAPTTNAAVQPPAQQPRVTGVVLASNQKDASASVIDLATGQVTNIAVGDGPHEAAISHDGGTGAVSIYGTQPAGNKIAIIDLKTATITKTIDLGTYRRPHGMTFLPGDSKLIATSEASGNVVIVDIPSGTVEGVIPTRARTSHMLAMPLDAKRLYTANVSDGSISEIDLATRTHVASYPIATQTEGISISPDGHFVWVGSNNGATVSIFDTQLKKVVATIPAVGAPYRIGVAPNGKFAIVADPTGGRILIVDAKSYQIVGTVPLDGGPEGIAITPDSRTAFITLNEGNSVAQIDIDGRKEVRRFTTGAAPDGVAYSPIARE